MKIVIISTAYPFRGGVAQCSSALSRELQKKGHDVKVITFTRQYPRILFPGKTQIETGNADSARIESERIIDSIGPLSWLRAAKRVKQIQPDLIVLAFWMPFFGPCFGSICRLAGRATGAKIIYICHNVIPHERRIGDIALTKFALRPADYFIVLSHTVESDLLALFPNADYQLTPHPIVDIFGEVMPKRSAKKQIGVEDDKVILFFGYVRGYKGLDLLIAAMPKILHKLAVKLLVVGEFYEDETKYRKLVDQLHLRNNVFMHTDFVPTENVGQYFSASDVVVLPYRTATQSGVVPVAYHFEKPCIVTDVGGLAEIVLDGRTGFVVPPESPDALAESVLRFYEEEREEEFSAQIRIEKKKYSWDPMISAIEGVMAKKPEEE